MIVLNRWKKALHLPFKNTTPHFYPKYKLKTTKYLMWNVDDPFTFSIINLWSERRRMMGEELRGARLDLGRNQYMNRLQTDRHMADCTVPL